MIMSMFPNIPCVCITNRKLVRTEEFLPQIARILEKDPDWLVLREKDLTEEEYGRLAEQVIELCEKKGMLHKLALHKYWRVAKECGIKSIHMPLGALVQLPGEERQNFEQVGTSVHSIEELRMAEKYGASYCFAGHVFATDCKRDLPPRGLDFLNEICQSAEIPVYAIGGIRAVNASECVEAGATGVCIMSACMRL